MIESTAPPACPHVHQVEVRYAKALPKGLSGCVHELIADISTQIEKTAEGWVAVVEMGELYEWGEGSTEEEAVNALVCNMGQTRLALKDVGDKLPEQSARRLETLEGLVRQRENATSPHHGNCSEARAAEQDDDEEPEILERYAKFLPKGQYCCGHELKADLRVEIERAEDGWTASLDLECLYEWGAGITEQQAVNDLVCSLGEYRLWLIERRDNLAGCSARDLELIEDMVI